MKVLLDDNLPERLASALHILVEPDGHTVQHLRQKFVPSTTDSVWLGRLASEGEWVVISRDIRISRNKHEREVWRQSGLVVFFLAHGWRNMPGLEIAWRLLRWWPRIVEQAGLVQGAAAFEIPVRGQGRFRQL